MPRAIAKPLAIACEALWRAFGLRGKPPITRTVVELFGREVTVVDARARRELGYVGHTSIDEGLARIAPFRRP